jgi:hypothetical protein
MTRGQRHPAEAVLDWFAPAILSTAAAWAGWRLAGTLIPAGAMGLLALVLGVLVMRTLGVKKPALPFDTFEPAPFADIEPDELLLDDPLVEVESDARVVRLFEPDVATPGEMIARIADFLGEEGRSTVVPLAIREESASPPDASAALHAALANIRASLR